jgi:hypothetical protein
MNQSRDVSQATTIILTKSFTPAPSSYSSISPLIAS